MAFFQPSTISTKRPLALLPKCGACGLSKTCQSPKIQPSGKGEKKILIIGEAPSEIEDQQGTHFAGKSGHYLREVLRANGIDPNVDCTFTNALICRPPENKIVNEESVSYCRPNVVKTIKEMNPTTIILLGTKAVESVIGWLWKERPGAIAQWIGWKIPSQSLNAWICPSFHPSYVLRQDNPVTTRMFESHIKQALLNPLTKPHKIVADARTLVEVITDTLEAANCIKTHFMRSKLIAFDFETDRLKPDHKHARIVSCSLSDGEKTIAYPWSGLAIDATWELLLSKKVGKVGFNSKFEDRWVRRFKKKGVVNWVWDGQLVGHMIDNRPNIASLKFQAFVNFGQGIYDEHIKPYLIGEGGNGRNNVHKLDIRDLLFYNGLDSLLEYQLAVKQMNLCKMESYKERKKNGNIKTNEAQRRKG